MLQTLNAHFKKFTFSFLASLVLLFYIAPYVNAQTSPSQGTWYNQDFKTWYQKVDDVSTSSEIFGERYTSAQVEWVIYGLFAFFIHHMTPQGVVSKCMDGDVPGCLLEIKTYLDSLAIKQGDNQSLASLVIGNRPVSGFSYTKNLIDKFDPVPEVQAQAVGFGFTALEPVQEMWRAARDIAFGLFVFAAIIFAFMVMFRVKINPQTVITIQSAIPKIVMALIAVTFSYAIAGFLIDLMYVTIGFISLIATPMIPQVPLFNSFTYTPPDVFNLLTVGPINDFFGIQSGAGIWGLLAMYLTPLILLCVIILFVSLAAILFSGPFAAIGIIGLLLLIILILMLIWTSLRIFWTLFKAFANIILLTIFAPIQLALGVLIPNFGLGAWVRNYISHLATFVTAGTLWLFAWIFMLLAYENITSGGDLALSSNIATSPWPPLIGGGGGVFWVFLGVSFVLFTMIPKAAETVQAFMSGKPFAYGSAIGEAFGPIRAAWGATGAPIVTSWQQAAARDRVLAAQNALSGWYDRHPRVASRIPSWLKKTVNADPGEE